MTALPELQSPPIVSYDHNCVIVLAVEDLILVSNLFPTVCTVPSNVKCKQQIRIGIVQAVVENFMLIILVYLLWKLKHTVSKNEFCVPGAHKRHSLIIEIVAMMLKMPLFVSSDIFFAQINPCCFVIKICSSPCHICHFYFLLWQLISA